MTRMRRSCPLRCAQTKSYFRSSPKVTSETAPWTPTKDTRAGAPVLIRWQSPGHWRFHLSSWLADAHGSTPLNR
jgi:hypothetical protein